MRLRSALQSCLLWWHWDFCSVAKSMHHIAETNEKFTTAAQITDDEQFQYALATDFGNVIAYGNLVAEQPVSG